MVSIFGLDIPPGLEEAFFSILGFGSATAQDTLRVQKNLPSRFRLPAFSHRSLMVRLDPVWLTFDGARRSRWQTFWGSWPGSGYSAFIELNAPRIRLGLDLLLDPPGENLVLDPNFSSGGVHWNTDVFTFVGSKAYCVTGMGAYLFLAASPYLITLQAGHTYRVSGYIVGSGGSVYAGMQWPSHPFPEFTTAYPATQGFFSFDFTAPDDTSEGEFLFIVDAAFVGYVEQPSVVDIT